MWSQTTTASLLSVVVAAAVIAVCVCASSTADAAVFVMPGSPGYQIHNHNVNGGGAAVGRNHHHWDQALLGDDKDDLLWDDKGDFLLKHEDDDVPPVSPVSLYEVENRNLNGGGLGDRMLGALENEHEESDQERWMRHSREDFAVGGGDLDGFYDSGEEEAEEDYYFKHGYHDYPQDHHAQVWVQAGGEDDGAGGVFADNMDEDITPVGVMSEDDDEDFSYSANMGKNGGGFLGMGDFGLSDHEYDEDEFADDEFGYDNFDDEGLVEDGELEDDQHDLAEEQMMQEKEEAMDAEDDIMHGARNRFILE